MASLNVRGVARASIERLFERKEAGEFVGEGVTHSIQVVTLDNLESHYDRFVTAHMELVAVAEASDIAEHSAIFDTVEQRYTDIKAFFKELIDAHSIHAESESSERSTPRSHVKASDIRLEKVNLEPFQGEFNKWIGFRDLFGSLIHENPSLTTAAKYSYLMRKVKGEAHQVVAGFLPTDDNYEAAWNTLNQRYNNDRLIVSSLLNVFLSMEAVKQESGSGLRRMVDITNETTRSLASMKRPVEHWDDILVYILISKLPKTTVIAWEMKQKGTSLPTLSAFLKFIEGRARGLDHLGDAAKEKAGNGGNASKKLNASIPKAHTSTGVTPKLSRTNLTATERGRCQYCQGEHYVGRCPSLEALPAAERFGKLKDSNLCYNCLTPGHSTRDCKSRHKCAKCNGSHHTILCRTVTTTHATTSNTGQPAIASTSQPSNSA